MSAFQLVSRQKEGKQGKGLACLSENKKRIAVSLVLIIMLPCTYLTEILFKS
jgi:hypothetical protein